MDRLTFFVFIGVLLGLLVGVPAEAQTPNPSIRLVLPTGLVREGEVVTAQIQLNTAGIKINAAEVVVEYFPQQLEVLLVAREQSIFTLWPEPPSWSSTTGEIQMSGGRPGGLYPVNAAIATMYFRVKSSGEIKLDFDLSRTAAYQHDGRGTRIALTSEVEELQLSSSLVPGLALISTTHPTPEYWSYGSTVHVGWVIGSDMEYSYSFSSDPQKVPDEVPELDIGSVEFTGLADGIYYFTIKQHQLGEPWSALTQRRFLIDGTAPEPFVIESLKPSSVDRAELISWNAFDATSGIVRYILVVGGRSFGDVESPLELQRSWRGQVLTITAIDAAGNEQSATWRYGSPTVRTLTSWWVMLLGLIVGMVVAGVMTRRMLPSSRSG